jgi:hypothetical protein
MSGEEVARARINLDDEIKRTNELVKRLQFQEAEENLLKVDVLYKQLLKVLNTNSRWKTVLEFYT